MLSNRLLSCIYIYSNLNTLNEQIQKNAQNDLTLFANEIHFEK